MKPLFHVSLTKFTLFAFLIISFSSCSKAVDMSKYQEASKMWEKEIQQLEAKDKAETDPQNAILFVGSSSIRLWKNIKTDMHLQLAGTSSRGPRRPWIGHIVRSFRWRRRNDQPGALYGS